MKISACQNRRLRPLPSARRAALLLTGTALVLCAPAKEPADLTQAGVQAAFQILRQDYIRAADLDFDTLNRAALDGLLERLQAGARIVPIGPSSTDAKSEPRVLEGRLADQIGWVRPLSYAPEEVELLVQTLTKLRNEGCKALILDLRAPAPGAVFETAAAMLDCFVPPGRTLFRLAQADKPDAELFISSKDACWQGPVVALISAQTSSAGEAVAAVLQDQRLAVLLGEKTAGATARYQSLPLDEKHALQYASAEMLLADGRSIFQKGLQPDLEITMTARDQEMAAKLMTEGRVRELAHEVARPRFNEAALVAGRNPELESYLRRSSVEGDQEERHPPADPMLQRAVDLFQTRWRLDGFKLPWEETKKAPPDEPVPQVRRAAPVSGPGATNR